MHVLYCSSGALKVSGGMKDVKVLKTTQSGFEGELVVCCGNSFTYIHVGELKLLCLVFIEIHHLNKIE